MNGEKGFQHAPLKLPFVDYTASQSSLIHFIDAWHDAEGLCQAIDQVRPCLVLMIDRHIDGQSVKCLQQVDLATGLIHIQCFEDSGSVTHLPFQICAVGYHTGASPHSGHCRCAIMDTGWFTMTR